MQIVRGLPELPLPEQPCVVTVGFFDGVHRGHQAVFARTAQVARERGIGSVAVTFDRHPREILTPGSEPRLLTTVERRAQLIERTGIDKLVVLAFDRDFSLVPAQDFVADVLVGGIHAVHAVVGANFTFGFQAQGNVENLSILGAPHGLSAESVPLLEIDGRTVSSTSIRDALALGDLRWPEQALGGRFVLDGEVVTGHGRGRGLGYPTANLR
ncbi:MAG: riboflavin kinase, partial [Actinomycetota bacterium]